MNKLHNLDKKYPWSFLGYLIGMIALVYTFYVANKDIDRPIVGFEVLSSNEIIQFLDNRDSLKILYKDKNIVTNDTTVYLISLKLSNSGEVPVKITDYDSNCPLGVGFDDYFIINKPIIVECSNDYLRGNVKITSDSSSLIIEPIILEEDDYISFNILLYGNREGTIGIETYGKIVGQKQVGLYIGDKEKEKKNDQKIYLILTIVVLFLISIVGIIYFIDLFLTRKFRGFKIRKFKVSHDIQDDTFNNLFTIYTYYGKNSLKKLISLSNDGEIDDLFRSLSFKKRLQTKPKNNHLIISSEFEHKLKGNNGAKSYLIDLLSEEVELTPNDNSGYKFTPDFKIRINQFYDYLNK
jgi:hypothetical protein